MRDHEERSVIVDSVYHLLDFEGHTSFPEALREAAVHNNYQIVLMTGEFNTILTVETRHLVKIEDAVQIVRSGAAFNSEDIVMVPIGGIVSYWGYITITNQRYVLLIVDNDDQFEMDEMRQLARVIELAIGMWKYTPERDARAEFIKSAIRGDLAFCRSLLEEADMSDMHFVSAFLAEEVEPAEVAGLLEKYRQEYDFMTLTDAGESNIYGMIYTEDTNSRSSVKNACLAMYNELKGWSKDSRFFHITGIDTIDDVIDGFRLINRTWQYTEIVFPYKRVFSKYEMSVVCDCVYMRSGSTPLQSMYLSLLEPFEREVSKNKGKLLLDTLATFVLDAGMNSNRTAEFMDIHNNTVQYRLKKANEILGADMTANRVIPGLTMALAIKRLEEK